MSKRQTTIASILSAAYVLGQGTGAYLFFDPLTRWVKQSLANGMIALLVPAALTIVAIVFADELSELVCLFVFLEVLAVFGVILYGHTILFFGVLLALTLVGLYAMEQLSLVSQVHVRGVPAELNYWPKLLSVVPQDQSWAVPPETVEGTTTAAGLMAEQPDQANESPVKVEAPTVLQSATLSESDSGSESLSLDRTKPYRFQRRWVETNFQVIRFDEPKIVTLENVFGELLGDATKVEIYDRYIRREFSIRDVIELLSLVKEPRKLNVILHTSFSPGGPESKLEVEKRLEVLTAYCKRSGINLLIDLYSKEHDRWIQTDRFQIMLGIGLTFRAIPSKSKGEQVISTPKLNPVAEARIRPTLPTMIIAAGTKIWNVADASVVRL